MTVTVELDRITPPSDFDEFTEACGLHLEPFQRDIAAAIRGPERELLVLLPRGQGKTLLLAATAVHHLLTVKSPRVYVAAASRQQATILFEYARDLAQASPFADLITFRHLELRVAGGHLRVLAADAPKLHGLTPSLAISDEGQAHASDDLYIALRTSMLKRPDAKMVNISTAGQGADSPLGRLRARALSQPEVVRDGAFTDARGPGLRMLEWSVPEDGDVDDPHQVKQANPASWVTVEGLREQRRAVPDLAFRRYHANMWTAREGHWLPPGAWQACAGDATIEDGEQVWAGVDIGGSRAASAVVLVTQDLRVQAEVFHGDEAVLRVAERVQELAGIYTIREVAYDPWRFRSEALRLEESGLIMVEFPQSTTRMVPATERLYAAIIERRLTHDNQPELNTHVAGAIAKQTNRGIRLDKGTRGDQIDAAVALCMAVERAEQGSGPAELLGWL